MKTRAVHTIDFRGFPRRSDEHDSPHFFFGYCFSVRKKSPRKMLAFAAAVATVLAMLLGLVYRLDDLAAHVEDDVISAARALVGSAPAAPAAPAVLQQSRPTPPSRASSHISEMRLCVDPVGTTSCSRAIATQPSISPRDVNRDVGLTLRHFFALSIKC